MVTGKGYTTNQFASTGRTKGNPRAYWRVATDQAILTMFCQTMPSFDRPIYPAERTAEQPVVINKLDMDCIVKRVHTKVIEIEVPNGYPVPSSIIWLSRSVARLRGTLQMMSRQFLDASYVLPNTHRRTRRPKVVGGDETD
jgi:hypothetical protein